MTKREVWFERWLWSYMPVHWKGWAITIAVVAAVGSVFSLLWLLLSPFGREDFAFLSLGVIPLVLFGGDPFMRRHSKGWND